MQMKRAMVFKRQQKNCQFKFPIIINDPHELSTMYSTHGSAKGPLTPHSTHMWLFLSLSEGDQASEACPWRITGRLEHGLIFMKLNMAYYSSRETMVPVQLPYPLFCPQILRHLYNHKGL